jgi:hypothetical protein
MRGRYAVSLPPDGRTVPTDSRRPGVAIQIASEAGSGNLILRQQINVLCRQIQKPPQLNNTDRFLLVWLYRWFPSLLGAIAIVRPKTIICWHRAAHWRCRSAQSKCAKESGHYPAELRKLIGEMSRANRLWGAPHIQGELSLL